IALYLTYGMWLDPNHRAVAHNQGDQALFEWLLSYAAYSPTHGADPWWTTLLNYPMGANLAVNTSMVVVGGLLAPVTLTLGAPVRGVRARLGGAEPGRRAGGRPGVPARRRRRGRRRRGTAGVPAVPAVRRTAALPRDRLRPAGAQRGPAGVRRDPVPVPRPA